MQGSVAFVLVAVGLAACGSAGDAPDAAGPAPAPAPVPGGPVVVEVEYIAPSPREDVPSGLATYRGPVAELPPPTIDLDRLRSGGPPPDGIPSIDFPVFLAAGTVDHLADTAPVLALEIDGDARAYPLEVMIWHELVNDTVGGVPVAVAYCPLCNSVTVFDRRVEGRVLEFGVSGLLYNSSLVMYDRQTETLWSHFIGEPLYGALAGAELVDYPATIVGFGAWRDAHPDGLVLSRDTGHDRQYGQNPYPGYDSIDASPFLFEGELDGRFTPMTRVAGVAEETEAIAFPLVDLQEERVLAGDFAGEPVVALWSPGSSSALDTFDVSAGADVGATGVFRPRLDDGRALTLRSIDGAIVDDETGSTWNVFGAAVDGPLVGAQLPQLVHIDTFWFAWAVFHPDSAVVTAAP